MAVGVACPSGPLDLWCPSWGGVSLVAGAASLDSQGGAGVGPVALHRCSRRGTPGDLDLSSLQLRLGRGPSRVLISAEGRYDSVELTVELARVVLPANEVGCVSAA